MRYFAPEICLSAELPPQTSPEDKFGGRPWGLGPDLWPVCQECGASLTLLAQFVHHSDRLDLGREGRLLSVFQCSSENGCATWDHLSGANACFVTEPEDLAPTLTPLPADAPQLELESRVVKWHEKDDGVSELDAEQFLTRIALDSLPAAEQEKATWGTRLGGVPYWIQDPYLGLYDDAWGFVGQLGDYYKFHRPPALPTNEYWVEDDDNGRVYVCQGPNFGTGIAHLFLRYTDGVPEGWFSWQC